MLYAIHEGFCRPTHGIQKENEMTSTKIRSLMIVTLLSIIMALPMAAHSALVGSVSTSDGSVVGGGDWTTDVTLGWEISDAPGDNYLYSYTFQAPDPGLSHFILQTSDNFTVNNVLEISNEYALNTFTSGDGNSNPGLPGDLYGIKFEGFEEGSPWTFTLLSDKAPMEGDFYAKGGEGSYAYNSGFGEGEGGAGAKILVPDTLTQRVPEAGAMLLFGSGLLGLVGYRRARRMQ
jgi:hypothetical protein